MGTAAQLPWPAGMRVASQWWSNSSCYESVVQEGAAETTPARAIAVIDLRQDATTPPTIITPWDIQARYPEW
jgi:hypothetical protein